MTMRRTAVTALLAGLGAIGGAAAAVAMNFASSLLAGEPGTAGYVLYHFNVLAVATLGAIVAPVVAWSLLRETPIWRAVVEPSAAALAAGALSMVIAPSAYLWAIPAAAGLASWRLNLRYPHKRTALREGEFGTMPRLGQ